jgi:hypothetical protein
MSATAVGEAEHMQDKPGSIVALMGRFAEIDEDDLKRAEPEQLLDLMAACIDLAVAAAKELNRVPEEQCLNLLSGGSRQPLQPESSSISGSEDLEKRRASALQHWEMELRALAQHLEDEGHQNGWVVRYRHLGQPRQLTAVITINGAEFARFSRDQIGIIGVFDGGDSVRFGDRYEAFDAAVKRRIA